MFSNARSVRFQQRPEGATNLDNNLAGTFTQSHQQENVNASNTWAENTNRLWNPVDQSSLWNKTPAPSMGKPNLLLQTTANGTNLQQQTNNRSWAKVVEENKGNISKPAENASWRKKQQVLFGIADEGNQGACFSADAELVAHNVAKNITIADLCNWLSQRGLLVKDCSLLTTSNEARSLAFKITIDPKDLDRATNDPALWPYGVGVRVYKNFNKNTRERDNERRPGNSAPSR